MSEVSMFRKEITAIGNALGLEGEFMVEFGFSQIMAIIKPEPEMETVEVVRLMCDKCQRVQGADFDPAREVCYCHETGQPLEQWTYTKLTGTYQRAKKQPVERSVSVEAWWSICDTNVYPVSKSDSFDWPALIGKTGTLTFVWQEEQ